MFLPIERLAAAAVVAAATSSEVVSGSGSDDGSEPGAEEVVLDDELVVLELLDTATGAMVTTVQEKLGAASKIMKKLLSLE